MEKSAISHLEGVLDTGTEFRVLHYFSDGFTIWRQYAWGFIIFAFLYLAVSMTLSFIPYIGGLVNNLWFGPVVGLGGSIVSHQIFLGLPKSNEDFTKATGYSVQIVISQLILSVLAILLMIPFIYYLGFENLRSLYSADFLLVNDWSIDFKLWYLLLLIPPIYAYVLLSYATHFIYFYDLPAIEAIKYSARFVSRHWFFVFVFFILMAIMMLSGLVLLIIGMVLTMSFIFPMLYCSFQDLTRLHDYLTKA